MAVKELTPIKCPFNEITKVKLEPPTDTSNGCKFTLPRSSDEYIAVLVLAGTSGGNVVLKAPTKGHYAAATSDKTIQLGANETAVIRIESARYANTDGTVVIVPDKTELKLAAIF